MKNTIITLLVVLAIGAGVYFYMKKPSDVAIKETTGTELTETSSPTKTETSSATKQTPAKEGGKVDTTKTVIGTSSGKNSITAYHFGNGETELLFVGGIHGGYEWNTVLLAYQLMDYLKANPNVIPKNIKVTVIPVLNPDGLSKVVGTTEKFSASSVPSSESVVISGRFNANNVDLNRNFDCNWKTKGVWQTTSVSGGSAVFSEPESQAVKKYVEGVKPSAVVVWYSAGGGVYSSSCNEGISTETNTITKKFAAAANYPAYASFDSYETSGDMVNWLAKNKIPAISVLLTNHTDIEWAKNKAGVEALLKYYTR